MTNVGGHPSGNVPRTNATTEGPERGRDRSAARIIDFGNSDLTLAYRKARFKVICHEVLTCFVFEIAAKLYIREPLLRPASVHLWSNSAEDGPDFPTSVYAIATSGQLFFVGASFSRNHVPRS